MSIYVLLEYMQQCKIKHKQATVNGLYSFKELWR